MTYADAQPRGVAIKDAILSRRMPPWGAVKGFGVFRNDWSLSQEQIELVTKWVDGGIRRGNNAAMLPAAPSVVSTPTFVPPPNALRVSGPTTLHTAILLDGLFPERVAGTPSMQVTASLPGGHAVPLIWLHEYDARYQHPFLYPRPLHFPPAPLFEECRRRRASSSFRAAATDTDPRDLNNSSDPLQLFAR
jgi:hypothetical protein